MTELISIGAAAEVIGISQSGVLAALKRNRLGKPHILQTDHGKIKLLLSVEAVLYYKGPDWIGMRMGILKRLSETKIKTTDTQYRVFHTRALVYPYPPDLGVDEVTEAAED